MGYQSPNTSFTNNQSAQFPTADQIYVSDGLLAQSLRTPSIFKTAASVSAAGNTAIWTPAAGKRFRLMRYKVLVPGNTIFATTAGTIVLTFQDAAIALTIGTHTVQVPTTAAAGVEYSSGWIDLGNGYLSSAANNALNANLVLNGTGALTGGFVIDACGTEE